MILDSSERDSALLKPETMTHTTLKEMDPPPYSYNSSAHRQHDGPPVPPSKPGLPPRPNLTPRPSVNQMHLQEKSDPISGTFYIDPRIPSLGFDAKGDKKRKKNPPHASFRSRHGPISLDLGTTGDMSATHPKANVLVSTRSGSISVRLLPRSPLRPCLGLEALSRRGTVVLFVPPSFSGAIQLNTYRGSLQFLPGIASSMKVLKETDTEALILLGNQPSAEIQAMDFCQLNTRTGKIIVGLSGVDKYDAKLGFWQKLVNALGGDQT